MKAQSLSSMILALLVAALLSACRKEKKPPAPAPAAVPAAAVDADNHVASTPATAPDFGVLKGRWVRPDGGYVIDIQSVDSGGRMAAAYFNPSPIHVARAEAAEDDETIRIFLELRDVNYPGSTYNLVYEPTLDCLQGTYFQATLKETFDVVFARSKP